MTSMSIQPGGTASSQMSRQLPQQQPGLPQTGLQQQMQSLNALYSGVQQSPGGFNVRQSQFNQAQAQLGGGSLPALGGGQGAQEPMGGSLDQLARNLAQRYGLPIGRGRLVDEQGNFLYTPQQLANASGGSMTMGDAAASMNYIAQAIQRQQQEQQQAKGIAALQTGLGQVQSRGRGSLAGMMSGYYTGMADLYASQQYEAADFSYYIQKEQMEIAQQLQRRQERAARRGARGRLFAGIGMGVAGLLSGNIGLAIGGFGSSVGAAGESGWF